MAFPSTAQSVKRVDLITETSCRICLKATNPNDTYYSKENINQYYFCTGFLIQPNDLPKKICQHCLTRLVLYENFIEQATITESQLAEIERFDLTAAMGTKQVADNNNLDDNKSKDLNNSATLPSSQSLSQPVCDNLNDQIIKNDFGKVLIKKEKKLGVKAKKKKKEIEFHPYCCKFCHQAFVDRITLQVHRDLAHTERDKFYCDICNNEWPYKSKRRLLEHMQYKHCNEEVCPFCNKKFRKVRLNLHLKVVHSEERSCICQYCGTTYSTKLQLRRHIKRAHIDWKYECNICGKKFPEQTRLNLHKAVHNPQNVSCPVCGKVFAMIQYLKQHMNIHNQQNYKCPLCPEKIFSFVTTLRSHISISHPEIPMPPAGTVLKNFNWNQILKSVQF